MPLQLKQVVTCDAEGRSCLLPRKPAEQWSENDPIISGMVMFPPTHTIREIKSDLEAHGWEVRFQGRDPAPKFVCPECVKEGK